MSDSSSVTRGAAPTVLWLADYGAPYGGAAVSTIRGLATHCRERGWGLECGFTSIARGRRWVPDLTEAGIPVDFAPDARVATGRWLEQKVARMDGPALLHTHFAHFDLPALAVARRRPQTAAVWHVHSSLERDPLQLAKTAVKYGWLGRKASAIICVSEGVAASVRRRGGSTGNLVVIENGIDTARFPLTSPDTRAEARAALGLPAAGPVLLHFCWDWQIKGGSLFVESLARLRAAGTPAVGIMVGAGEEAAAAAERLGLGDALRALPPSENVRRFYDAADVLLATSPAEGAPMAVVEALSAGLPIIATDIPGHRWAGTAPAAIRLTPFSPEVIAATVASILAAPGDARAAEAERARSWVEEHRGLGDWVARIGDVYEAAMARAGK